MCFPDCGAHTHGRRHSHARDVTPRGSHHRVPHMQQHRSVAHMAGFNNHSSSIFATSLKQMNELEGACTHRCNAPQTLSSSRLGSTAHRPHQRSAQTRHRHLACSAGASIQCIQSVQRASCTRRLRCPCLRLGAGSRGTTNTKRKK